MIQKQYNAIYEKGITIIDKGEGTQKVTKEELRNIVKNKRLACIGDLQTCSYAKRMKCLWWNECYVETLARELQENTKGEVS